jgi:hypothetical protein
VGRGGVGHGVAGFCIVRQVRRGSLWFGAATTGMEGFVKAGMARRGLARCGLVG